MLENTVLFVVASRGYHPIEYAVSRKLIEQAGFQVMIASDVLGSAIAADESTVEVDVLISQANAQDYDGIFFIGGPGTLDHLNAEDSYALIQDAYKAGLNIGAICIATRIFAYAGVLRGKRATGWNDDGLLGGIYKEHEVQFVPQPVIVDGSIITAEGPNVAREFGERIITLLQE